MAQVPLINHTISLNINRPAFFVGWPGAMSVTGVAAVPPTGGTVKINTGSHFNTSTMRFTCPVNGIYMIGGGYLRQTGNNIVVRMNAFKNGNSEGQQLRSSEGFTGFNYTAGQWWIINANAGDLLDIKISADAPTSLYADAGNGEYNWVSGYLLG